MLVEHDISEIWVIGPNAVERSQQTQSSSGMIPCQRLLICNLYARSQTHEQNPQLVEQCLLVNDKESLWLYEGPVSLKLTAYWNHWGALKNIDVWVTPQRFNNWTGVQCGLRISKAPR